MTRALKVCAGSFGHRIPGFWCGSMGSVLHERVAGRVFAGVMGNWSDGGVRAFGGLTRALKACVCRVFRARIPGFWRGSKGSVGYFDMILSVVVVVSRVPRN